MAKLIIFRGKAATGKTLLTSRLSSELHIPVLRKDDIFDPLSKHVSDNSTNNAACYDILAQLAQTQLDSGCDTILDISLCKSEWYKQFLAKMELSAHMTISFLCDCSDEKLWLSRHEARLLDPKPNQYFKSIDEVRSHYAALSIEPLDNEIILDSAESADKLFSIMMKTINSK